MEKTAAASSPTHREISMTWLALESWEPKPIRKMSFPKTSEVCRERRLGRPQAWREEG
jgi:hypothetical protein